MADEARTERTGGRADKSGKCGRGWKGRGQSDGRADGA